MKPLASDVFASRRDQMVDVVPGAAVVEHEDVPTVRENEFVVPMAVNVIDCCNWNTALVDGVKTLSVHARRVHAR